MKLFKLSKLKKFSSYFIELIIVVLGVSIAFQLNVWNDSRKTKKVEDQLLDNFYAENNYNIRDSDSSAFYKRANVETGLALIEILKKPDPSLDSARIYMGQLYEISWPNFTTTHLENYLDFTTGSTPLREEMLNLMARVEAIRELGQKYIDLKQEKYFDYLSDAVDMNDNLIIVRKDKVLSIEFTNNLMLIVAYEQSMADVLDDIEQSQQKLDSLIKTRMK